MTTNTRMSAIGDLNADELDLVSGGQCSYVDFGSFQLVYGTDGNYVGASVCSGGKCVGKWEPTSPKT